MQQLASFKEDHISWIHVNLMGASVQVFNHEGPWLAIIRAVNMKDIANRMRSFLVDMHAEGAAFAKEAKAIHLGETELFAHPLFEWTMELVLDFVL